MNELLAQQLSDYITSTLFWYFGCKVLGCRINKFIAFILQVFVITNIGPRLTANMPQAVSMAIAVATVFAQFIFLYGQSLKMRIIASVVAYTAVNVVVIPPFYFAMALGLESEDQRTVIFNIMYLVVGFCAFYMLVQIWNNISFVMSRSNFLTFFLLPLTQFAMSIFVVFYLSHNPVSGTDHAYQMQSNRMAVIIFTSILALSLLADGLFLKGFANLATGVRERALIAQLEQKNEQSYEYIKGMESDIEDMSKYRHDSLNLLTSIRLAVESGGEDGKAQALDMLERFTKSVEGLTGGHYCRNVMVNCVLSYMQSKMERGGISGDLKAEIGENTGINEFDLCRLMMNMLDNACEGCGAVPDAEKRSVSFNMREKDGFLYIVCRNSCPEGELALVTSKDDRKHHGLGLGIMREIAKKYDGELIIEPEDGFVSVTAALRIAEKEESAS